MLEAAIVFFVISLIAGAMGFTGIARGTARIARILFLIFIVLAILLLVLFFAGIGAVA